MKIEKRVILSEFEDQSSISIIKHTIDLGSLGNLIDPSVLKIMKKYTDGLNKNELNMIIKHLDDLKLKFLKLSSKSYWINETKKSKEYSRMHNQIDKEKEKATIDFVVDASKRRHNEICDLQLVFFKMYEEAF